MAFFWYWIAVRIYASKKFWSILIWQLLKPTDKFSSPPIFSAIQYANFYSVNIMKLSGIASDNICLVDDVEEIPGSASDCGGSEEDIIV